MKRRSFFKSLLPALSLPFIFDYVFGKKNEHVLYEAKPGETESEKLRREVYFLADGITWEKELSGKANVIHRYRDGYYELLASAEFEFNN